MAGTTILGNSRLPVHFRAGFGLPVDPLLDIHTSCNAESCAETRMSKTRWPRKAEKNMGLGWLRIRTLSDTGSQEVHHVISSHYASATPGWRAPWSLQYGGRRYSSACRRHLGENQFRHPFSVQAHAEPEPVRNKDLDVNWI